MGAMRRTGRNLGLLALLCVLGSLIPGCQALARWDRVGAGVKIKTTGWVETLAGAEVELFFGAERVPRNSEGGVLDDEDVPDWFRDGVLLDRLGLDDE